MANLTVAQMAELLLGIARSQQAIIEALENSKAGFKSTHFRPSIETAARIRTNRAETLADFPSKLLLQMLGRTGPDAGQVTRELEALLSRQSPADAPGASSAPSLDMTGPA